MSNALIILLAYGFYLLMVALIVILSWYAEKLDPSNELPPTLWDEIYPAHRQRCKQVTPAKDAVSKAGFIRLQPAP